MYSAQATPGQSDKIEIGCDSVRDRSVCASRLPRRTIVQSYRLPPVGDLPGVTVRRYPAIDRNCRHQIFVENETELKRYDLPATGRVEVCQRFYALAGEMLAFDYVILLQAGDASSRGRSSLTVELKCLEYPTSVFLISHAVTSRGNADIRRVASKSRENVSYRIGTSGTYELHTATSLNSDSAGSSAKLLMDAVQVSGFSNKRKLQLASVCCFGCVRQETKRF